MPADQAAALHAFFITWVSGRGLYPNVRIGRQPYGVVVTSAWDRWAYPQAAPGQVRLGLPDIAPKLAGLLRVHRPQWATLGGQAAHAASTAADPFQRLLSIIGLLASSADYVSRKAVPDDYINQRLNIGGADKSAIQNWRDALNKGRAGGLAASGIAPGSDPIDPQIAHVAFLDHTDGWQLPIVDRDPKVPLSETAPIGAYDGTHNYLDWLGTASRSDISAQHFVGGDGIEVGAPAALLYTVLRHALLTAVEEGSLAAATIYGRALFEVVDRDPPIVNVGAHQNVLWRDYLEVNAATLGLAEGPIALADWALQAARAVGDKPDVAALIAEVQQAIAALAPVPTARLERLLAEHLDVCSYRLDAWIGALYAQWLAGLKGDGQQRRFYLGGYGWVENLRPKPRASLAADTLPEALRDPAGAPVFEDIAGGGFIHAPSLNHAASASVLRNAYLSHADSANPLPFAVNLSSARMRDAKALAEGVRNGQPIAALLGYQIERGLYENHPGIELDAYIYALRDRFPLLAAKLTALAEGGSTEVIEARNVVNGLDLIEFTAGKTYPWGIAGLPAADPGLGAIRIEVDRARDALDAVADLMLSESVHQAVQCNMERTKASLQALAEPQVPPEPEVITTPRSGVMLAFRTLLMLDAAGFAGWSAPLSARAAANPPLNHWLAAHLPPAAAIQWTVADGGAAPATQSLAALGIEPLDLVLMSGDRIGDQSSELERLLIRRYCDANAVPDEHKTMTAPPAAGVDLSKIVLFDFTAADPGGRALAGLQPLLSRLRRLITAARAGDARDVWRSADLPRADPLDPAGVASEFVDLTQRLDDALAGLATAGAAIKSALVPLATLRSALDTDPTSIANPGWPPALATLRTALFAAQPFVLVEALPADGTTVTTVLVDRLIGQGTVVAALIDRRHADAATLRMTAFADPLPTAEPAKTRETTRRNDALRQAYLDCAKAMFGPSYVICPLFHLHPAQAGEIAQALAQPPATTPLALDQWASAVARVRPSMAELQLARAAARWIERPIAPPALLQLPFTAGGPWIGGELGPDFARGEWLSLSLLEADAIAGPACAALMLDDWTEQVPTARETTGIAFNYNRPNAVAPQAILVAVPPVLRGNWEWADLVGAVAEGLDLAKVRVVEHDQLLDRAVGQASPNGDFFQTLPAILSESHGTRFAHVNYAAAGPLTAAIKG